VDHWQLEEAVPGRMIVPGMIMYWFGSDLFYANVGFFAQQIRKLVNDSPTPVHWLAIDCSAITDLDFSAGRAVMDLHQDLAKAGVVLALSRLQVGPHGDLERMGLVLIGRRPNRRGFSPARRKSWKRSASYSQAQGSRSSDRSGSTQRFE